MKKFKRTYYFNFLARFTFLLITPVFFQYFALGFIWHSIYWGVLTLVLLIWLFFILFSPLIGRIGCGWFCFMGTINDFVGKQAAIRSKWKKPLLGVRLVILLGFIASAFTFYLINAANGITHDFRMDLFFLRAEFSSHYKMFWLIDILTAILFALILDKRWFCKNLCMMGFLCALGSRYSRLIPVADPALCIHCHKCEKECLTGIPIVNYIQENKGLITNPECILCGKCIDTCKFGAIHIKFIWSRRRFKNKCIALR